MAELLELENVWAGYGEATVLEDISFRMAPGDSLAVAPSGVDVLAVPAYGPWAAMKETVDFAREVGAVEGFCIHDGLLNERGWSLVFNRVREMTPCQLTDLRGAGAWTPA